MASSLLKNLVFSVAPAHGLVARKFKFNERRQFLSFDKLSCTHIRFGVENFDKI